MAPGKQKYYVVWQGHNPGIYDSWDKAKGQVNNFPHARYKAFNSRLEAEKAYKYGANQQRSPKKKTSQRRAATNEIIADSISVDAACSGNPGLMEYRGVRTEDKSEIFHVGPVRHGTNNIGEFLAIVHALALLKKQNDDKTPVYTDSRTALSWIVRKKANTKLKNDATTAELHKLIVRAEQWLKNNTWKNPILKWNTSDWGEIPADFNRK